MRIDRLFSVSKERSCVFGVSVDFAKSYFDDPRQWFQIYLQILFWEFSMLIAWNKAKPKEPPVGKEGEE